VPLYLEETNFRIFHPCHVVSDSFVTIIHSDPFFLACRPIPHACVLWSTPIIVIETFFHFMTTLSKQSLKLTTSKEAMGSSLFAWTRHTISWCSQSGYCGFFMGYIIILKSFEFCVFFLAFVLDFAPSWYMNRIVTVIFQNAYRLNCMCTCSTY
jgi:hypothetical protein